MSTEKRAYEDREGRQPGEASEEHLDLEPLVSRTVWKPFPVV